MTARFVRAGVAVGFAALSAAPLRAQCPDGSSPPCARPQSRSSAVTVDPHKLAVLPFRVATADSLLGEGFAELLAPEFTGEGGPRAVDMSTTLSAWRRAGGGLRSPLPQDKAMQVAREIGAGLLAQGSIVGFGGRLTINATLFDAATGQPMGAPARAVGPPDSVDVLLRLIATNLLTASGATARVTEAARLTSSPAALRSYLEGLALWRGGKWGEAERAFEQSVAADSGFAPALYRLWLLTTQTGRGGPWERRLVSLKDRLTPRERTVFEASVPAAPRTIREAVTTLGSAAERLVDSPEAWFLYADDVYHNGHAVLDPDSAVATAHRAFSRAVALDEQPLLLYHLMEIATRRRDTTALRRLWQSYDRMDGEERWAKGWVIAAALGDAQLLARLRQSGPSKSPTIVSMISLVPALDAGIPAALMDEGFRRLDAVSDDALQRGSRTWWWVLHSANGRPAAAERALRGDVPQLFQLSFVPYAWVSGDVEADEQTLARYGATPLANSAAEVRRSCFWAYVRAARGTADTTSLEPRRVGARCALAVRAAREFAAGTLSDATVTTLDSLVARHHFQSFLGFEHRLLARVYEARGDTARALQAIRRYPRDYAGVWLAPTLREVGRLSLATQDTAGALRAYEHFLTLRAEPEPAYVAERDSIRAIVGRLRRR